MYNPGESSKQDKGKEKDKYQRWNVDGEESEEGDCNLVDSAADHTQAEDRWLASGFKEGELSRIPKSDVRRRLSFNEPDSSTYADTLDDDFDVAIPALNEVRDTAQPNIIRRMTSYACLMNSLAAPFQQLQALLQTLCDNNQLERFEEVIKFMQEEYSTDNPERLTEEQLTETFIKFNSAQSVVAPAKVDNEDDDPDLQLALAMSMEGVTKMPLKAKQ